MKLSVNVENLFYRFPFAKGAEIYKNAGFDAVDYALSEMVNDTSPLCGHDYRAKAEEIRKTAEAVGIPIHQTHAPFTFAYKLWADETSYRETVYPRLCRSVEISALLGAKVVVMHPLHHFPYRGHEEEIFARNMEFYRSLIPVCRDCGIVMGIENMWAEDGRHKVIVHDTCSQATEFVRYIDTLDSDYMKACLDLGHIGLPAEQRDEVQDVIRILGHDRLAALHVHDNDYRRDLHNIPFEGRLRWGEIMRALKEIGYTGDFTYETTTEFMRGAPDDFVQIGARYMADVGHYLIGMAEGTEC